MRSRFTPKLYPLSAASIWPRCPRRDRGPPAPLPGRQIPRQAAGFRVNPPPLQWRDRWQAAGFRVRAKIETRPPPCPRQAAAASTPVLLRAAATSARSCSRVHASPPPLHEPDQLLLALRFWPICQLKPHIHSVFDLLLSAFGWCWWSPWFCTEHGMGKGNWTRHTVSETYVYCSDCVNGRGNCSPWLPNPRFLSVVNSVYLWFIRHIYSSYDIPVLSFFVPKNEL